MRAPVQRTPAQERGVHPKMLPPPRSNLRSSPVLSIHRVDSRCPPLLLIIKVVGGAPGSRERRPTNTNMKTTHPHACERTRRLHPKRLAGPPQRPSSDTPVHINQFYTARDQRYSFFSAPKDAPKMQAGRASPLPALLCSGRNRDSERAHPRRQNPSQK